jgi:hypothetical protein
MSETRKLVAILVAMSSDTAASQEPTKTAPYRACGGFAAI